MGSFTIRLTVSGIGGTDTAVRSGMISVQPGPAVTLQVTPDDANVSALGTTQFHAEARDEFGNPVPITPQWTVTRGGGTIDANGTFGAGKEVGFFGQTIVASIQTDVGELRTAASVTIEPGPLFKVLISPPQLTLDVGAVQRLGLGTFDEHGNKISRVLVSWQARQDVGTIDAEGLFTAGTRAGFFPDALEAVVVSGTDRISSRVDVTVQPGPLARIAVQPSSATLQPGQSTARSAS